MEAEGHSLAKMDHRCWWAAEIGCINDDHVARISSGVVDDADNPTSVLAVVVPRGDEHRLHRRAAWADIVTLGAAQQQIVLSEAAKLPPRWPDFELGAVAISVRQTREAVVDSWKLLGPVVKVFHGDFARDGIDGPALQIR